MGTPRGLWGIWHAGWPLSIKGTDFPGFLWRKSDEKAAATRAAFVVSPTCTPQKLPCLSLE